MGKAVEHLVASMCVLGTGGELNAWTSIVDDEGVDVVLQRRKHPETLALQVKARFTTAKGIAESQLFRTEVRKATFEPQKRLYLFFVVVEPKAASLEKVWIVPSLKFVKDAPSTPSEKYKFIASAKPDTKDRWSKFAVEPADAPQHLLTLVKGLKS
jgi:hypothetical protein